MDKESTPRSLRTARQVEQFRQIFVHWAKCNESAERDDKEPPGYLGPSPPPPRPPSPQPPQPPESRGSAATILAEQQNLGQAAARPRVEKNDMSLLRLFQVLAQSSGVVWGSFRKASGGFPFCFADIA